MQEPSPGGAETVSGISPGYPNISMIGQCLDVSEAALASGGQGMIVPNQNVPTDPQTQAQFEADKRAVYKYAALFLILKNLISVIFSYCNSFSLLFIYTNNSNFF